MGNMLTAAELAERLKVKPDTVRLWTREGIIPAIHITGKIIRYEPEAVDNALRRRSDRRAKAVTP